MNEILENDLQETVYDWLLEGESLRGIAAFIETSKDTVIEVRDRIIDLAVNDEKIETFLLQLHKSYQIKHREIELDENGKVTEDWLIKALPLRSLFINQWVSLVGYHERSFRTIRRNKRKSGKIEGVEDSCSEKLLSPGEGRCDGK